MIKSFVPFAMWLVALRIPNPQPDTGAFPPVIFIFSWKDCLGGASSVEVGNVALGGRGGGRVNVLEATAVSSS